ncbi:zinc finger and BTB domain-containing protein 39-like isoform X2 [Artemia franciscana]|uniref:zinc finger and BTB domain-containing protein 39-like isoform X2 n=1 Tax=Artemia franciscana TaxID=6661 RepID=UPI0032DBEDE4
MQHPQTQQQFSLKWNSHQGNMLKVFTKLMQSEQFTDVTLAAEGKTLKAHRVILSACSAYFEKLLSESGDKNYPIILLRDITYLDLSAIVEFMYKGEIHVTQDNLGSLLKTAESLKVKGLAEVCEDDTTSAQNFSSMPSTDAKSGQALPISQMQFPSSMGGHLGQYPTMSHGTPPLKKKRGRPRLFDSPDDDFSAVKQEGQIQDPSDIKDEGPSETTPQNTPPPASFSEQASTQSPHLLDASSSNQVIAVGTSSQTVMAFTLSKSERGNDVLIHKGYKYLLRKDRIQGDGKKIWRCREYKKSSCNTNLLTNGDQIISISSEHSHPGDPVCHDSDHLTNNHAGILPFKQETHDEEMPNESSVVENTEEVTKEPSSKLKSNPDVSYVDGEVFYCGMKVIKFNDYIQFRSRAHFWEEPVLLKMMDSVKNKTLDMKSAADLLGVSYGTLYGRYRENFGYLKHPWASRRRDSGHSKIAYTSTC